MSVEHVLAYVNDCVNSALDNLSINFAHGNILCLEMFHVGSSRCLLLTTIITHRVFKGLAASHSFNWPLFRLAILCRNTDEVVFHKEEELDILIFYVKNLQGSECCLSLWTQGIGEVDDLDYIDAGKSKIKFARRLQFCHTTNSLREGENSIIAF